MSCTEMLQAIAFLQRRTKEVSMISRRTKEKVGVAFLHTLLTIIALAIIAGYVIPHIGKIPNISWIVTDSKAAP